MISNIINGFDRLNERPLFDVSMIYEDQGPEAYFQGTIFFYGFTVKKFVQENPDATLITHKFTDRSGKPFEGAAPKSYVEVQDSQIEKAEMAVAFDVQSEIFQVNNVTFEEMEQPEWATAAKLQKSLLNTHYCKKVEFSEVKFDRVIYPEIALATLGDTAELTIDQLNVSNCYFHLRSPFYVRSLSKAVFTTLNFKKNTLEQSTERVVMLQVGNMRPEVQTFAVIKDIISLESDVPVFHFESFTVDASASHMFRM